MQIVLASRNKDKIREMNTLLSQLCMCDLEVLSLDDIGFYGEIEEDGESFEENAIIKACEPVKKGYIGIADDSGLTVDALGGAPGIFSARYSKEGTNESNNRLLLKNMEDVPDGKRQGAYVCVIALVAKKGTFEGFESIANEHLVKYACQKSGIDVDVIVVRGECRGEILREYAGTGGFGYDPLFYFPEKSKTFAQISSEEKNEVSHRGLAVRKLAQEINKITEKR